ncbi:MAG: SUMF1/EgtB/PvdO family nonheme iron enzyme [Phycisphaerae bacterium]|jgi:formylglycine-generating enzyme required for sulfatase activity|nr:SUMF1/EgtB/PvdO family nonheme iron enzyme [Phycisphaerae bacterium]
MKSRLFILTLLVSLVFCIQAADAATEQELVKRYTGMLDQLRTELKAKVPQPAPEKCQSYEAASKAVEAASKDVQKASKSKSKNKSKLLRAVRAKLKATEAVLAKEKVGMLEMQKTLNVKAFLASDALDAKLVKYVVLRQATPEGLAQFAGQGKQAEALIDQLLANADLMKQILVADGAKSKREGRSYGPAQYGPTMKIYTVIRKVSDKASEGVLQRLALAIALEHAIPVSQQNSKALTDGPEIIDPARRYLHYEKAYLAGELDPAFKGLSTWDLRMVVNGHEPDETLAWGRQTLRNFRPDHVYQPSHAWRYVGIVSSDVKYGSGDNKYDRPELQFFQNILMNGGVCGRRAFFGRFMLRAWGIPTIARPSRGHAALARWTPKGWVVCLGPGWGGGKGSNYAGRYPSDTAFLATTQARSNAKAYLQVKRAYWVGDVLGEKPTYGEGGTPEFWSSVALKTQRAIITETKAEALKAVGENLGEADGKEKATARPDTSEDKKIAYSTGGVISIPAAAYSKPAGSTKDVKAMKSFAGGLQVFLPRFSKKGVTVLRGGTWKGAAEACTSGIRLKSGGYGRYANWGFRAAVTHASNRAPRELTLDLGDGVKMEFVYIKPGAFAMGGEKKTDGRFDCVEVPKHAVTITKGFYLGKYEVTQAQYQAIMGSNPSRSTKAPNCPADNVSWDEALKFCADLAYKSKRDVRLPTEAEWEYASRAGKDTKWFFGADPAKIGEYAWFKDNAGGKSHPVGEKKPNPWGLYDIYGNVCERIADTYDKDYYAKSPKTDPTGPSQGTKSQFEYEITVPRSGEYSLTARVVTANYDQNLVVSANDEPQVTMMMPFTVGQWRTSEPVTLTLKKGANTLRFLRCKPPQKGVAIKSFALKPAK